MAGLNALSVGVNPITFLAIKSGVNAVSVGKEIKTFLALKTGLQAVSVGGNRLWVVKVVDESQNPIANVNVSFDTGANPILTDVNGFGVFSVNKTFGTDPNGFPIVTSYDDTQLIFTLIPFFPQTVDIINPGGFGGFILVVLSEPNCIVPDTENISNFIRWNSLTFDVPNNPDNKLVCCDTLTPPLPNPFIHFKCKQYLPFIKPGDQFAFYINFTEPINDLDFDDWKLGLIKINITNPIDNTFDFLFFNSDLALLEKDIVTGGFFNIVVNAFEFPITANGEYQLLIYNSVTGKTKFLSNKIQVQNGDVDNFTLSLKYRNSFNTYNFQYENLPNFFNLIRIHLHQIEYQYENGGKQYKEVSTGTRRNLITNPDKPITLQAFWFDEEAHDAMNSVVNADNVNFNNKRFRPALDWETEPNMGSKILLGSGKFYPDEFSTINTNC